MIRMPRSWRNVDPQLLSFQNLPTPTSRLRAAALLAGTQAPQRMFRPGMVGQLQVEAMS